MATTANNNMATIYAKIAGLGYKKQTIKQLLPEWWDDNIASTPSGLQQTSLIVGKLFGIRPDSLWTHEQEVLLSLPQERKFKHHTNTKTDSLDIACALAYAAARLVLQAYKPIYRPDLLQSAHDLRNHILQNHKWPNLTALLSYCEQVGIPVIYLACLPNGAKKIAGLAFEINNRPVIVVTQTQKYGYLLFDIAHELGHISLGHVTGNKCVIDERIDENTQDDDEIAANSFALSLLTGSPNCKIVPTGRYLTGEKLALTAFDYAKNHAIDPSHIALNYGYSTQQWGAAHTAVNLLAENAISNQQQIRDSLFALVDTNELSEDDLAVLHRYCGA